MPDKTGNGSAARRNPTEIPSVNVTAPVFLRANGVNPPQPAAGGPPCGQKHERLTMR